MSCSKISKHGVGALMLAAACPVLAQNQAGQGQREEVLVTGTRITQPDFQFSNPVTSIQSETILSSGQTNLTSYLTEFPALTGSLDSFDSGGADAFIGGAGLNLLDLRNLGTERTLVLVDGRRHVATLAESSAVDINTIPIELVERVDIMTGGASAVYGADGVTGVVNFVLRDDFEGLSVRAQTNEPTDAGAGKRFVSATFGRNFSGGRGNVAVAAELSSEEELFGYDRDFNGGRPGIVSRFQQNPADGADDPDVPDRIPFERTGFGDTSRCGAIFDPRTYGFRPPDFNCDGTPWDFGDVPPRTIGGQETFPIPPFFQVGGDATPQDDYVGFSTLRPETERGVLNVLVSYEFNDLAQFFSELKYVESDVWNLSQPSFDFGLPISAENPYIPESLEALAGEADGLIMQRDNFDLGVRGDAIERTTERAVLGVSGDMPWASYEVSFVHGTSEVVAEQTNNRFDDRFFAALDAVDSGGVPDCRVNVNPEATPASFADPVTYDPAAGNCVPLNLFGDGAPSQEAIDWIMQTTTAVDEIEQQVLTGYLNGDTDAWFSLPGGPMGWAAGVEHREESSRTVPDEADTAGATFGNVILPNYGEFDVSEAFVEANLPLLSGATAAEELTLETAYRYSDYSTIGQTDTWKLGVIWAPIRDVTLRATVAEAVRAPNIGELFGAENQTFALFTDPCDIGELESGSESRAENCATLLSSLGQDPDSFSDPITASKSGVIAGNPELGEETADTRTYGIIFQPRFVEDLTVSIDYYDIELTDAVAFPPAAEIAERCVDAPTLDNQFCELIERDPATGGISSFRQAGVNLASYRTSGYDFALDYTLDPARFGAERDLGLFSFRLVGNKLSKLEFVPSPGADVDNDLGEGPGISFNGQPVPEWQATFDLTWDRGPLTINYGLQWFDETQRISNQNLEQNPDRIAAQYYYYDAKLKHDVHARYDVDGRFAVLGGINNVTDERTAFDSLSHPVSPIGRTYYVGLRADLR